MTDGTADSPRPRQRRRTAPWIAAGFILYWVIALNMRTGNPYSGILMLPAGPFIFPLFSGTPLQAWAYVAMGLMMPLNAFLWGLIIYGAVVLVESTVRRRRHG